MFRPSRGAAVIAASFALALASVAPSALAARGGDHDDDTDEQTGGLLDLIDITDLLGGVGLPALGELPTVEGIGLPALEGVGLPALEGVVLPGLDELGVTLPIGEPIGLPGPPTGALLDLRVLVSVGLSGQINLL